MIKIPKCPMTITGKNMKMTKRENDQTMKRQRYQTDVMICKCEKTK